MKKILIINSELYALTLWLIFHGAAGTIVIDFVSPAVSIPRPTILRRGNPSSRKRYAAAIRLRVNATPR